MTQRRPEPTALPSAMRIRASEARHFFRARSHRHRARRGGGVGEQRIKDGRANRRGSARTHRGGRSATRTRAPARKQTRAFAAGESVLGGAAVAQNHFSCRARNRRARLFSGASRARGAASGTRVAGGRDEAGVAVFVGKNQTMKQSETNEVFNRRITSQGAGNSHD